MKEGLFYHYNLIQVTFGGIEISFFFFFRILSPGYGPVFHEICVWSMMSSVFIVALNEQSLLTVNLVFKIHNHIMLINCQPS